MFDNTTVTSLLQYADISMYLGAEEYEKEKYYNWVDETDRLEMIDIVKDVLRYYQPYKLGSNSYDKLTNYLYSLIGKWIAQATVISNNTHGIVAGQPVLPANINTGVGQIGIVVGATGSPIINGQTSYSNTILASRTIIVVLDGVSIQPNLTGQFSYTYFVTTGTITFNMPLNTGQVLTITYFS
jgi:hypothetical protein